MACFFVRWSHLLLRQSLCIGLLMGSHVAQAAPEQPAWIDGLKLPPGFQIQAWARVNNARQMHYADGVVYVGSFQAGEVNAVRVKGDYSAGEVVRLASGQDQPVGVAVKDNTLYFSAVSQIKTIRNIREVLAGQQKAQVEILPLKLPTDRAHGWKFIAFGPDGQLYIPQGAPCNICEPDPERYAMIGRYNLETGQYQTFAKGIRNSVGFDWNPKDKTLWATNNGRDWLGEDLPPDVLINPKKAGMHFGYPYCHAGTLADPELGSTDQPCSKFDDTAQALGAHVAPLGMRFFKPGQFPSAYQNRVFIAEHGSWNRKQKTGYRITTVEIKNGKASNYNTFIDGWYDGQTVHGRPADVEFLPDGSMLVSDDAAGLLYRVTYVSPQRAQR